MISTWFSIAKIFVTYEYLLILFFFRLSTFISTLKPRLSIVLRTIYMLINKVSEKPI